MKAKKRNYAATDATLINIRALKKRVADLETRVTTLELLVGRRIKRQR